MEERKHLSGVDRNQEQGAKNRLLYPETRGFGQPTGVHRLVSSSLSLAEVLQQLYFIRKKMFLLQHTDVYPLCGADGRLKLR